MKIVLSVLFSALSFLVTSGELDDNNKHTNINTVCAKAISVGFNELETKNAELSRDQIYKQYSKVSCVKFGKKYYILDFLTKFSDRMMAR